MFLDVHEPIGHPIKKVIVKRCSDIVIDQYMGKTDRVNTVQLSKNTVD